MPVKGPDVSVPESRRRGNHQTMWTNSRAETVTDHTLLSVVPNDPRVDDDSRG